MICQAIDVPNAQDWPAPVLRFRYHIFTYDVLWSQNRQKFFDSFNVGLCPSGGIEPTYVFTDGNRDPTSYDRFMDLGWQEGTVDLRPYAGQRMKICFANVTREDELFNTWTIVDEIRLVNLEHRIYLPVVLQASRAPG